MSDNFDKLDAYFKKHQSPHTPADEWEKIQTRLPRRKNKFLLSFYTGSAVTVVLLLLFIVGPHFEKKSELALNGELDTWIAESFEKSLNYEEETEDDTFLE